ncbi:hypothetical protein M5689_015926 [Euphorbia peplus]|nr:hypothetical protein M5689_015926 [Euphorbia peplus]
MVVVAENGDGAVPTQMVDSICKKTSDYTSCVKSLYSDRRTPGADQVTLAYIAVDLAYSNAAATRDLISEMLSNSSSDVNLRGCAVDYANAVSKMQMASNDVNSETFSELTSLSAKAYDSADHCQKSFPSFTKRNNDFKALCEIVGAVGKLFTG